MSCFFFFFIAEIKEDSRDGPVPLKSPRTPKRGHIKVESEEGGASMKKEPWEPPDWRKQLSFSRGMRSGRDAPVDHMGANKCFDPQASPEVTVNYSNTLEPLAQHLCSDGPHKLMNLFLYRKVLLNG